MVNSSILCIKVIINQITNPNKTFENLTLKDFESTALAMDGFAILMEDDDDDVA